MSNNTANAPRVRTRFAPSPTGFIHLGLRPYLKFAQAPQHLVPRHLRPPRMTIGAQPARCLRQHRQQRGLGMGELLRRIAQIGPTGGRHALQGAAKRGAIEVQGENLVLGQVPFQLRCAPQLTQLAGQRARMRVEAGSRPVSSVCDGVLVMG